MGVYVDRWEYTHVEQSLVYRLLERGWEPFAVTMQPIYMGVLPPEPTPVVHLRRLTGERVRIDDQP